MKLSAFLAITALCAPGSAIAADDDRKKWAIAIDGGTSTGGNQADQPFVAVSVTRDIGDSYVQLSVSQIMASDGGSVRDAIPATTRQVKVAGGTSFGALSIDAYASVGDRVFKSARIDRKGRTITLAAGGSTASGGIAVTYDHSLSSTLFLSPFLALDYDRVDTARVLVRPGGGITAVSQPQTGLTGSGGIALQYLFGPSHRHAVVGSATFVTTSNDSAVNRSNAAGGVAKSLGILAGSGRSDSWGELGAIASYGLSDRLSVNIAGVRTLGFGGGDSTSVSVGTRLAF